MYRLVDRAHHPSSARMSQRPGRWPRRATREPFFGRPRAPSCVLVVRVGGGGQAGSRFLGNLPMPASHAGIQSRPPERRLARAVVADRRHHSDSYNLVLGVRVGCVNLSLSA